MGFWFSELGSVHAQWVFSFLNLVLWMLNGFMGF
jgi:hypothetical protein